MKISLKEFKQNTYKYLKPGTYILTNHDVATLIIEIIPYSQKPNVATDKVATEIKEDVATEVLCKHKGRPIGN